MGIIVLQTIIVIILLVYYHGFLSFGPYAKTPEKMALDSETEDLINTINTS